MRLIVGGYPEHAMIYVSVFGDHLGLHVVDDGLDLGQCTHLSVDFEQGVLFHCHSCAFRRQGHFESELTNVFIVRSGLKNQRGPAGRV